MTAYGEAHGDRRDEPAPAAPTPDAEGAVYATEHEGEQSVEGVAAALAQLGGREPVADGGQTTIAQWGGDDG